MKAFKTSMTRLTCVALLTLSLTPSVHAAPLPILHLMCSGVETTDIIYGTELDPPRKGDFRVEYIIDLEKKGIANARTGNLTPISIDEKEINFGAATDFNPDSNDGTGPKTNGTSASATAVVINRTNGRYFSISTRKFFSTDPLPEGVTEPLMITNVRTRQGVCTDGTPSPSS
jgi:hypothetical protein